MDSEVESEVLHADGNWVLTREHFGGPYSRLYIMHVGCPSPGHLGPYRSRLILNMECDGCKETAPEGLKALYLLMTWDDKTIIMEKP